MGFSTWNTLQLLAFSNSQRVLCAVGQQNAKPRFSLSSPQNAAQKDSNFGLFQQDVAGSILGCFNLAMMCVAQLLSSPLPNSWSFHL